MSKTLQGHRTITNQQKRIGRRADSRWPQADNSCSVVQLRSPNEDRTTTEKVQSSGHDGTSSATAHS